jgi:hypothetical protein
MPSVWARTLAVLISLTSWPLQVNRSVALLLNDNKDYYSKSTTYLEWLLGFITGYNAAVSDPDKQMQLDIAAVDLHVRNWCAQNPTSNIFTAVHQLLDKNNPK